MESPPGLGSGPLSLGCVEVDPPYMAFPSHQDFRRVVVAAPFRKIFFQFLFFIFFHSFFIFFNFPQFFPILFPILFLILPFFLFLPQFFSIFFTDLFPDFLPFFHNFSIFPISFKCFFPQIPRFGEATEITSCSPVTPDVLVTPIPVPPPPPLRWVTRGAGHAVGPWQFEALRLLYLAQLTCLLLYALDWLPGLPASEMPEKCFWVCPRGAGWSRWLCAAWVML